MNRETIHLYVNMPGHTPCFSTIAAALESIQVQEQEKTYPAPHSDIAPAVIHIGPGIYREKLVVTRPNLTMLGEGESRDDAVLVWGDGAFDHMPEGDKRGTFRTASVRIDTHDFTAKHLTFQNDAGYGRDAGQALALYVDGDRIYFEDCRLSGSQDTLFTAPLPLKEAIPGGFKGPGADRPRIMGRHCFRGCLIQGDVDFIFGGGIAWFEDCVLFSKLPEPESASPDNRSTQPQAAPIHGYITAASTPESQPYGYVFQGCRLESDCPPGTVMLGRPWREWAKTVYLNCEMGPHIHPAGWADWGKPHGHFYYGEYRSTGPGASPETRADFSCQLTDAEAAEYTMEKVLDGWTPGAELKDRS
ncbi:MAG: pectinesterase family protein [Firmicutes bacterium]|nr:pectinesterase family protein [Bacillota bacterium]